jgi:formamidopyrimidine-DNA glycosylase
MIEIAESKIIASQLKKELKGKSIIDVSILKSPHKFCWMSMSEEHYEDILLGNVIADVTSSAHYIRIHLSSGHELACAEDVTYEFKPKDLVSQKNQLVLFFENDYALELKIKLYGFILLGKPEDLYAHYPYYKMAIDSIHPCDDQFTYDYFLTSTHLLEPKGSIKSALATEQHLPGLGNGTLQDILFDAKLSPKRKVNTLSEDDRVKLYHTTINKIDEMITFGGRDQTLSIYGETGGYQVKMSNSKTCCPICQTPLMKEAFLGGKVIYCPNCQK